MLLSLIKKNDIDYKNYKQNTDTKKDKTTETTKTTKKEEDKDNSVVFVVCSFDKKQKNLIIETFIYKYGYKLNCLRWLN